MGATLTLLGHSSFLVKTDGGKTIYIDPWFECPTCPDNLRTPESANLICVTHGHFDHTQGIPAVYKNSPCPVAGPYELVQLLAAEAGIADEHVGVMGKGGTCAFGDVSVTLTHAMHSSSYGAPGTYAGEPAGLILTLEDGKRVYHAGDTNVFGDMAIINELYSPDICLLPIGSKFTMDPAEAAKACELLQAKRAVPIHHSTFPPLTGTPAQFQEEVKKRGLSTEVHIIAPGESVTV